MTAWTQRILLYWEAELRFYERGVPVLRLLQDQGDLHAFAVAPEDVRGRLLEDRCELVLRRDRLDITLWGPDADVASAWEVVMLAFRTLQPGHPTGFQVFLQHLLPLASPPRDVMTGAYEQIFGLPAVEGVQFDDWAFLSDLAVPEDGTSAGMEFGIVTPPEIPNRLARYITRSGRPDPGGGQGWMPNLDLDAFADASLFADSWWKRSYTGQEQPFLEAALQFWNTSRERADRVVEAIYDALSRDDDQRGRRTA